MNSSRDSRSTTDGNPLEGEAVGEVYGTETVRSKPPESEQPARIQWDGGNAWRLRRLRVGNEPWALPGRERLFDLEVQGRINRSGRSLILVAGRHRGLSSFLSWLHDQHHHTENGSDPKESEAGAEAAARSPIGISLTDVGLYGTSVEEKLKRIAVLIRRGAGDSLDSDDPIDMLRELAERDERTILFTGIADLDRETAARFFGRLRALIEDSPRTLDRLGIVLTGRSINTLDPEEKKPVSNMLSVSEVWTLTSLRRSEIEKLADRNPATEQLPEDEIEQLCCWSGGEPVLVQALFRLIASEEQTPRNTAEAIRFLERERLLAFDTWVMDLKNRMENDPEIRRLIHLLLRNDSVPNDDRVRRIALLELLVDGWIRPEPDDSEGPPERWTLSSDCRTMLAREAFSRS